MATPYTPFIFWLARRIALKMFWYPVQRQVFPAMALRISFSLGSGFFVTN
jgi:hypothetical protein